MNIFFKISLFFFAFYDKLILVDLGALRFVVMWCFVFILFVNKAYKI